MSSPLKLPCFLFKRYSRRATGCIEGESRKGVGTQSPLFPQPKKAAAALSTPLELHRSDGKTRN